MKIAKLTRLLILFLSTLGVILIISASYADATTFSTVCSDSANIMAASDVSSSAFCQDHSTTNPILSSGGVLNKATNIITAIAGFIAVVMIIVSGLQMVTSSGNPEKISSARNTIIYSSVGLVVIALARLIILFIAGKIS
jgi:hypothetical protein